MREMDLIGQHDHGSFSVLLPRTTLQEGWIVAQRVHHSASLSDPPKNCASPIVLRVGVAEVAEGDDPIRLLQRAKAAMGGKPKNAVYCGEQGLEEPRSMLREGKSYLSALLGAASSALPAMSAEQGSM